VLLLAIAAASRGGDEIDKLLQRRLSPGVVALFARYTKDPRIDARLKEALSENAVPVRTVAARVSAVGGVVSLVSELKDALGRETDVDAAREEIGALCAIGGAAATRWIPRSAALSPRCRSPAVPSCPAEALPGEHCPRHPTRKDVRRAEGQLELKSAGASEVLERCPPRARPAREAPRRTYEQPASESSPAQGTRRLTYRRLIRSSRSPSLPPPPA
jgi:hypothetical protein